MYRADGANVRLRLRRVFVVDCFEPRNRGSERRRWPPGPSGKRALPAQKQNAARDDPRIKTRRMTSMIHDRTPPRQQGTDLRCVPLLGHRAVRPQLGGVGLHRARNIWPRVRARLDVARVQLSEPGRLQLPKRPSLTCADNIALISHPCSMLVARARMRKSLVSSPISRCRQLLSRGMPARTT